MFWAGAVAGLVAPLVGCAGATGGTDPPRPAVEADFSHPLRVYRQLGLITGPDRFPAVASVAAVAATGDSTLLLLGLSLPASALQFQRAEAGFAADYLVSLRVSRDSQLVWLGDWRETVRVPRFEDTGRTEEAVLFQAAAALEPGEYELGLRVRDGLSARGFETTDTITVPRLHTDPGLAAPILAYRARPRTALTDTPSLILNVRHTTPYGGPETVAYVERYGGEPAGPVVVEVRAEDGDPVWAGRAELGRGAGVSAGAVSLPVDSFPLGRYWLAVSGDSVTTAPVAFLVTISDQWLVANFDEVVEFLRYIAPAEELEPLTRGTAEERRRLWERFWAERDPVPATPVNEYRETFFERIRVAAEQFPEDGLPGWRTDRGEVYIVLGPPTRYLELRAGADNRLAGPQDAQEWIYERTPGGGRLSLVFVDRHGLGRYELTDGSAGAFRSVARRIRDRRGAP